MNDIEPKLKIWYESTGGGTASAGLLLAELAPEPDRGKSFPNGMTQLLLRTDFLHLPDLRGTPAAHGPV